MQRLPEHERPRERLMRHGAEAMSTAELIAIVLGSGTKSIPVLHLAQELVMHFGSLQRLAEATFEELCQIKGVGSAKALQLQACFSLGIRLSRQVIPPKYRIDQPENAYHLIKDAIAHQKQEHFMVILLDVKNGVIHQQVVAIGTLSQTLIHPREVFYPAVRHKAAGLILAHNHPSGDPTPSSEDKEVTKILVEAGHLMGIAVRDHLILGHEQYVSLRQQGLAFN